MQRHQEINVLLTFGLFIIRYQLVTCRFIVWLDGTVFKGNYDLQLFFIAVNKEFFLTGHRILKVFRIGYQIEFFSFKFVVPAVVKLHFLFKSFIIGHIRNT